MNKSLISNPFLFPPSGDNEEEKQLLQARKEIVKNYITYQVAEFEKAWKTAGEENANNSNDLWGKIPSEKEIPEVISFSDMMDSPWAIDDLLASQLQFDSDFTFSPINDNEKESQKGEDLLDKTNEVLHGIDMQEPGSLTMYAFGEDQKSADSHTAPSQQSSSQESLANDFCSGTFDLVSWCAGDENTENPSTINTTDAHDLGIQNQGGDVQPIAMKVERMEFHQNTEPEPVVQMEAESTSPQKRPRRKSAQTNRNIQDNNFVFPDDENPSMNLRATGTSWGTSEVKPLANLNGGRVGSVPAPTPSTSTGVAIKTEPLSPLPYTPAKKSAGKSNDSRRKRKYEEDDSNDPSVKNAKAAKMNRDKKKQQMQDLQRENQELKAANSALLVQQSEKDTNSAATIQQLQNEVSRLTRELNEERNKNSANAAEKLTMLHCIQRHINATFGLNPHQQPVVSIAPTLANMPMPTAQDIQRLATVAPGQSAQSQGNHNPGFLIFKVGLGARPNLIIDQENGSRFQNFPS